MTDDGLIEGSPAGGDAGAEYVTVFEADPPTSDDLAFIHEFLHPDGDATHTDVTAPAPSSPIAFGDTSTVDSTASGRPGCTAGACPHPVAHPAETDWEQLASAVPVEGQLDRFKPRCEGMSYPTEDDFRAAISAVRPLDPDSFALQRLRSGWTEEIAAVVADWPGLLQAKLAALSEGWTGADFDAFTDQADQARALVQGVLDDIEETAQELENREAAIYTLQGGDSGEIPYPAPMVGADGEWTNLTAIHVRPAWWYGDCIQMTCEQAEQALKLGGADPRLATDVRRFIEEQIGGPLTAADTLLSEDRVLAGEDAKTSFEARISAELAAYVERHAAIDEAITEKREGQSEQLESVRTTGTDRPCPDGADAAYMDLASPVMERPAAPVPPQTTQDPSPVPPQGDGSVKTETDTEAESTTEPETDSWEESDESDEEASGGLASGGGGFGFTGGGGFSTGGGAAASVVGTAPGGGYGFGGSTVAPFGAPGTTGAAPSTGSGAGGGGARTAMVGGSQQQQAADARKRTEKSDEDEESEEEEEDLTFRETENVWGYVRPRDDPYI